MNCRARLEIGRIIAPLLVCVAMSGPARAGAAAATDIRQNNFIIGGVSLGMGYESVLKIYPAAEIRNGVANCYLYGRAIRLPALTRRVLRHREDEGELTMNFEPPRLGGGLSRILYDRPVDPSTFDIGKLLQRLTMLYGPYQRILYRRKMEPAGRIVGFEWHGADDATLRVVLRNDYRNSNDDIRLSFLARSPAPAPRQARQALLQFCGKS